MNATDQILSRLSPSHVIGRYVSLKAKGSGEFIGLCPFHSEKTPSFTVSDRKGFYYCFGCGKTGNIFSFLMQTQNLEFIDALKILASEANVDISKHTKQSKEKNEVLYHIYEHTTEFYRAELYKNPTLLRYLEKRSIDKHTAEKFRLGYAPHNSNVLLQHLLNKYNITDIKKSGVLKVGKSNNLYDPFHNRLIFPISDKIGRVIAFGGRVTNDSQQPKYLNSSESEIFSKGYNIYNLNKALKSISKEGCAILVEGYMDVISLSKHGIDNVIAPLGTAIKEEQITLLWRITDRIIACLDSDIAGIKATHKLCEKTLPLITSGKSIAFAQFKDGKDPDQIVNQIGAEHFRSIIQKATNIGDMIFNIVTENIHEYTPENEAKVRKSLLEYQNKVQDEIFKTSLKYYFFRKANQFIREISNKKAYHKKEDPIPHSQNIDKLHHMIYSILINIAKFEELHKNHNLLEELSLLNIPYNDLDRLRTLVLRLEDGDSEQNRANLEEILKPSNISKDVGFIDENSCPKSAFKIVKRLLLMCSLHTIQGQINSAQEDVLADSSTQCHYDRLVALKKEQEEILQQINYIDE